MILARELALSEINRIREAIDFPVEVFVHGALCVAYSGQCLTSEALGGRSANRGECAEACRMPYQIIADGQLVDLENVQYLLSPQDLAAFELVPQLIEMGVTSLKIEGRLKTAEYVANITRHYRSAIDEAWAGRPVSFSPRDVREMQLSFSRGFSHGFLDGTNHKVLVRGDYAKKRGILIGEVQAITRAGVRLTAAAGIKPGDGVVFDGDESTGRAEQGGRVYQVIPGANGRPSVLDAGDDADTGPGETGALELRFGRGDIELLALEKGQRIWKTDDPELSRRLRRSFEGPPSRMVGLDIEVHAVVGEPLSIVGRTSIGSRATAACDWPLAAAETCPAQVALFREQLGRLGGTIYELRGLEATTAGGPMVPKSLLNRLRRELVAELDGAAERPAHSVSPAAALPGLLEPIVAERARQTGSANEDRAIELAVLCRRTEQIDVALGLGIATIYADYQDIKQYAAAIETVRRRGSGGQIYLATPRIEKPGESSIFAHLARQGADGMLVRNAGGLRYCIDQKVPFVADFSLNAANPLSVELLKSRGALRVTASYDLSADQLFDLLDATPPEWLEIVIHQQVPMFHMEHCVFCAFLSPGTDATNCGRPCDTHDVKLRDRVGAEHPLKADVGCRNTLYNAVPQTTVEYLPRLRKHGARFVRVELLDDEPRAVERIITLYQEVIAGRRDGKSLWRELKATNQYGVTRGALAVIQG